MEVTLDHDQIRLNCPMQFIGTLIAPQRGTLSCTRKGRDVRSNINWFDKTIDPNKFKDKPPPSFEWKMRDL